jgi:N-acyl-L-homoserine lactone synthetase
MQLSTTSQEPDLSTRAESSDCPGLLSGFRFRVCEDAESFAKALELRREVYVGDFGYDVPVPDEYDRRSWLLIAETESEGEIVGTMRVTPRMLGPLEAEEYFRLPAGLAGPNVVEISRFAIRRSHRRTHAAPRVAVGLFKLCYELVTAIGAEHQVICSKVEKLPTYAAMGFQSTGLTAWYEKLNGVLHELLVHDFLTDAPNLEDEFFRALFCDMSFDEVEVPSGIPPVGLVETHREPLRLAACA